MTLLIIFFVVSIVISFLCSIWEAVLLSIQPSYVHTELQSGSQIGKTLDEYKKDIDKPLSAILTLNTISHTVGAIGVGVQAGKIFGGEAVNLLGLSVTAETIIAGLMTLAILILSEIIPKTIGANYWDNLVSFTIDSLIVLLFILSPFVWVSQLITKSLKKKGVISVFSKADIVAMAAVSQESGVIQESESKVIKNLMSLDELTVHDIMTPRTVMQIANEDDTLQDFYLKNKPFRFSRIPMFKNSTDNVTGFFLKDELLQHMLDGKEGSALTILKREIPVVHENKILTEVLKNLTAQKSHMAIAVDDYGSIVGIVTLEDVLETVLGIEITDESDTIADLQAYARKRWEDRAKKMAMLE